MRRLLPLFIALALLGANAQAQDAQQLAEAERSLATALAKFDKALPKYEPQVRKEAPFLRELLRDYYLHQDGMTQSEGELAEALLSDLKLGAFGSRAEINPLMAKLKAVTPAPHAPASHHAPPTPPPAKRVARISGLRSKPTFASGHDSLPDGREVGYVTLSVEGNAKRIVEVPGTHALSPGSRAATVASRLRTVSAEDPLWWMKLRTASVRGMVVLRVPGSSVSHIITADAPFAKEWGTTPQELAERLRNKIKRTYDPNGVHGLKGRGGDERDLAIEYRQQGDGLANSNVEGAIEAYQSAIGSDPTYRTPYERLAALYRAQGKTAEAEAELRKADEAGAKNG